MGLWPALAGMCVLIVAGCARAEAPRVVVSVKPLHALAVGVMEGIGMPEVLIKGGGSVHAYTLRPSDAETLNDAQIVFWIGPAFERFLEKPLAALGSKARVVALAGAPGMTLLPARVGGLWDGEDHHGEGADGHLWLSPANAKAMVVDMAEQLGKADGVNAGRYHANAAALSAKIDALDRTITRKLAPVKDKPFFVFHDAYQYFEVSYALHAVGAITTGPDRQPGAGRLSRLKAEIARLGPTCVFSEPQFAPKLVQTVVGAGRTKTGILDPEGSTLAPGSQLYFNLMNDLADNLVRCLAAP